ncbi:MAG TPA: glycosyltransferase family 1 protein [Bacteroidetes bacterium]|nr:glycosyltransferase family 1 protein [Bacteroidota bacterium]
MRIVHVAQTLGLGGLEVLLERMALGLRERGHRVSVIALTGGGVIAGRLREAGFEVTIAGVRRSLPRPLYRLRGLLLAGRPDIVHLHGLPAGLLGRAALLGSGTGCVFHIHTLLSAAHHPSASQRLRERFLSRRAGAIVAVSDAVRRDYTETFGVPPQRVQVHFGGVPDVAHPSKRQARERLGIEEEDRVVVCAASLTPQKNHALLLEAMARVPEARLLLVGDGPLRDELEARAGRPDLAGRVRFLGRVESVEEAFAAADLAMLTSSREGLGLVLMEAARASLPAVVTDVGGMPEVVEDGVTGRVLPPGDAGALAEAARELLADEALRRSMGEAARARFLERYELTAYLARWEEIYRSIAPLRGRG